MEVAGKWVLHQDGAERPMVWVWADDAEGNRHGEFFLVDSGADQTVLSADFFSLLRLPTFEVAPDVRLEGIGGIANYFLADTVLYFDRTDSGTIRLPGRLAVFHDPTATNYSILGHNILKHFDVIVSYRQREVRLLLGDHFYQIHTR